MSVEKRVLKSVSEFSMFKYLLFFYLVFFLISVIVIVIIGVITWLSLSSFGFDINSILQSLGLGVVSTWFAFFGGGTTVTIIVLIVGGLVASVVYAAVGTLVVWIMNVVLKMSGGIELRFLPRK